MRERIAAFLAAHTTLTLATVGPDGAPAAAAVFYAHDEAFNLYFLSEERTRHGQNLLANGLAAGTIQDDGQDWRTIRGLQLRGHAFPASAGELAHAAAVYGRKYAFVAAQLVGSGGPGELVGPLARARFWVLRPAWFRWIDNTVRFGFKEEWTMEQDGFPQ
ncbi:MAG: pyridoxamine 5'-phosphate oxidase family protein [Anaerolineae bacterium]